MPHFQPTQRPSYQAECLSHSVYAERSLLLAFGSGWEEQLLLILGAVWGHPDALPLRFSHSLRSCTRHSLAS